MTAPMRSLSAAAPSTSSSTPPTIPPTSSVRAAKDFLNWLAEDKEGQEFISKDAALISPFKNNEIEASDPLGKSVKSYADAGKLIGNYNYLPDDHFSVLGAAFQKWLAGEEDRAGLAQDIQDYWKTAKFTGATA